MGTYVIGGSVAAVVVALGAWTRWGARPVVSAIRIGIVVGRMQQRRRDGDNRSWDGIYADVERGTLR